MEFIASNDGANRFGRQSLSGVSPEEKKLYRAKETAAKHERTMNADGCPTLVAMRWPEKYTSDNSFTFL
jgi:hypothetical protein